MKPKYEYKIVHLPEFINTAESKLNDENLARDMWELVTIFIHPNADTFCRACGATEPKSPLFALFKRPFR